MNKKLSFFGRASIIFCSTTLFGVDIGSDTTVNRFAAQQTLNTGDIVKGYAALEGGLKLFDSTVTATFSSYMPVSGTVALQAGTLELLKNLILQDAVSVPTFGNVRGNFHVLEFSNKQGGVVTDISGIRSCDLTLTAQVSESVSVLSSSFSFDNIGFAEGLNSAAGNELVVRKFDGTTFTASVSLSPANATIWTVRWHPTKYWLAVINDTTTARIYEYNPTANTLTLLSSTSALGDNGRAAEWDSTGNFLVIGTEGNGTGEIFLFEIDQTTAAFTLRDTQNLNPSRDVIYEAMRWDVSGTYLGVGLSGNSTNPQFIIYALNRTTKTLSVNATVDQTGTVLDTSDSTAVDALDWNPTYTAIFAIGFDAPIGGHNLFEIYIHNGALNKFTKLTGTSAFTSTRATAVAWSADGTCLALGTFGGEFKLFTYDDSTKTITQIQDLPLASGVNNGLRWSPDGGYISISGSGGDAIVYAREQAILNALRNKCMVWDNLVATFSCDLSIDGCCIIFTGNSVLNGRGMRLLMGSTGKILVGPNSSLLVKDIQLQGVKGTNIEGMSNTSTFTFRNVSMLLDSNYSFTKGKFDIVRELKISGPDKLFVYKTDQISTVSSLGVLNLDLGVTFSYDPPIASSTLLRFADSSAELQMNSAALYSTFRGMQLTKGKMKIDGRSLLINSGANVSQGFVFGNGLNSANNFCMEFTPAGRIDLQQGFVSYKNVGT